MEVRSSGEVCRRMFRLIIKEQLPWISGRTITPKCKFSGCSYGSSNSLSGSKKGTIMNTSRGGNDLWRKIDLVMVRRVEGLGGLRGVANRPAGRASQHGTRTVLPTSDEERHTDEFLKQAKKEQAAKVMKTEQAVGGVAGQSLAATETEFVNAPGRNDADIQGGIAEEMTRKGEVGAADSESDLHIDHQHMQHGSVDEEVKRGLVADSAFPIGRTEKKVDEDEETEHNDPDIKGSDIVSEHGSFKSHL